MKPTLNSVIISWRTSLHSKKTFYWHWNWMTICYIFLERRENPNPRSEIPVLILVVLLCTYSSVNQSLGSRGNIGLSYRCHTFRVYTISLIPFLFSQSEKKKKRKKERKYHSCSDVRYLFSLFYWQNLLRFYHQHALSVYSHCLRQVLSGK